MTLRQKHIIDTNKCVTAFVVVALMATYQAWDNTAAWLYLAMHGTYGFLWMTKSRTFGDKQWEKPTGIVYGMGIWFTLSCYWIAPWIIVSRDVELQPWYMGLCVALYGFGVFFHFASDMQKHISLQLAPGQLMTTGLWSRCRNPNYFGELLIYLGFVLLAQHWAPLLVLGGVLASIWLPNMIRKDRSLARYPEFAAWKKRSKLFIPFII